VDLEMEGDELCVTGEDDVRYVYFSLRAILCF
jgi:hypothetical protein